MITFLAVIACVWLFFVIPWAVGLGAVGWFVFGPIGAAFGAVVGLIFGDISSET